MKFFLSLFSIFSSNNVISDETPEELEPVVVETPEPPRRETCEDRIDDHLASRLADFTQPDIDSMNLDELKAFVKETSEDNPSPTPENIHYIGDMPYHNAGEYGLYDDEDKMYEDEEEAEWRELAETVWEESRERRSENVLSVTEKRVIKIQLMWGGPEDYFEIDVEDNEITGGRYWFKDWFDGAVRYLSAEQAELVVEGTDTYIEGVH